MLLGSLKVQCMMYMKSLLMEIQNRLIQNRIILNRMSLN